MVIHFPAAKLGLLAIRQLSRYVGNFIKAKARECYFFRTYVCMPPAQAYNFLEVQAKSWSMKLGKPVHVPPLTEAAAIDLGASILGEFIVFSIGASLLLTEYSRSKKSENRIKEKMRQERFTILKNLAEMEQVLQMQGSHIEDINKALDKLGQPVYHQKPKQPVDAPAVEPTVEEIPTEGAAS